MAKKYVYFFGSGKADGKADMKNLLGGKGANIAEMTNLGIPVPPGFTITTEVCTLYYRNNRKYPTELKAQVDTAMARVEKIMGRGFGDPEELALPAAAQPQVEIWTDAACKGNPGPGGWGALLRAGVHEKELFGGEPATTNNRMELTAVIEALASLKRRCRVVVHTDSQYVKLGVTEWLPMWIRRGWKTAGNKAVKNADLWRRLAQLAGEHDVDWRWVKGHAGVPGNERADALANRGVAAVSGR